ncbi:MAG: hypothetical protein JWN56_1208 [Sphingobacteriales bacterium]|nr:hypothetical protein [Sphingobacteriales bacterium]
MLMPFDIKIYAGTSGIVLPVANKLLYPPEFQDKSRLAYYASLFNSVEINSSFYKIPMASTVRKWAESVPAGFRFTFKLWKEITHAKELEFNPADVNRFMETIAQAENKEGCLLVQFPPSVSMFKINQLEQLLTCIQNANLDNKWSIAVEFRNSSWYNEEVNDLLNRFNSNLVIHDLPKSAAPLQDSPADFVYLRFHGPAGGYRGCYSDDFLYEYAQYILDWKEEGKTVYINFNNTMGEAVKNLITLNSFLRQQ